jgi:hypothetical protein
MLLSAEVRWFHRGPCALRDWFRDTGIHACPAGGGQGRTDRYLRDAAQEELGIKRRGEKRGIEIKGLVAARSNLAEGPFVGRIELWTKWTSEALELPHVGTVLTEKVRWQRKFDTRARSPLEVELDASEQPIRRSFPDRSCNVELTEVRILGEVWWTLGFEAFGAIDTVEADLRAVAALIAAERRPPRLDGWMEGSYPRWLKTASAAPTAS